MTKTDFLKEYEKFKSLFQDMYRPSFLNQEILEILEKDFTLLTTKQTRKGFRPMFISVSDELLERWNIADEEYFRIFIITHFDIKIEVITNDNINSILDFNFSNVLFKNIKNFNEIFEEDREDEMEFLFLNGKLFSNDEVFKSDDYLKIKNNRKKIFGDWKSDHFKITFTDRNRFYNYVNEIELYGEYFFMNNKIRLKFKNAKEYKLPEELYYDFEVKDDETLILSNYNYNKHFVLIKYNIMPNHLIEPFAV